MRSERSPRTTWLGRLFRARRPDRNPLRRASDRIETAGLAVLLAAFFSAAPFAAHAAADWASAGSLRALHAQQASSRQVSATLLQPAIGWNTYSYGYGAAPGAVADARWKAPDGQIRTGFVAVPSNAVAGSTVLVWTDRAGQEIDPPLRQSQIARQADLASCGAVAAIGFALLIVALLARQALDRRRLAAWEADWLATGPRWTARR
jgi:hypothetical protein